MNSLNCYLLERMISEYVRGDARSFYLSPEQERLKRDGVGAENSLARHRLLIKLAGLPAVRVRVPRWVVVNTLPA